MNYFLVHFRQNVAQLKKHAVYWMDETNLSKVPVNSVNIINTKDLPKYANQEYLLLVRSGGIGDIVAMSSICGIAPKTIFLTQKKYLPILDLFKSKPIPKHFDDPIFTANSYSEFISKLTKIGIMQGEDAIELGSKDDWYEIFSRSIGRELIEGRPQLIRPFNEVIDRCLIVSESSTINRTGDGESIKQIAVKYFKQVDIAHKMNWTTKEYIAALSTYKFVISVDTSAIHIREGFGLSALGLYGAFAAQCRTKNYTHTHSVDVIMCSLGPCFIHGVKPCRLNTNNTSAYCLTNYEQIEQELISYLKICQ
jgi:hypothetical protein